MANRYLYAGGDPGTVRVTAGNISSSTANVNTTYADHSISMSNDTAIRVFVDFVDSAGASDFVDSTEDLWLRWDWACPTGTTGVGRDAVTVVDGSDQPWLSIRNTGVSLTFGVYYNSGTGGSPVWTLMGNTFVLPQSRLEMNLKVRIGSPTSYELYISNQLHSSGSFTQASFTQAHAVLFAAPVNTFHISQMLFTAGIVTIGSYVYYGLPTAAGASSAWTGLFSAIDDSGASAINDTDLISSSTNGQRSTFAYSDVPALPSGYAIGDVFLYTRARNNGVAPLNIKPVRRNSGGTDLVGSNFVGMGAGFVDFHTRYTGLTSTEYNASQFGVEAAT